MFERTRVDTSLQTTAVPVEITLNDGEQAKGRFLINSGRSVHDVLNGGTQFLEFEVYGGERTLIAKSMISAIKIVAVPTANNLKSRMRDGDGFDPYAVLGVAQGASWDEIRQAYLTLSKTYHPDCYAAVELPNEVRDYFAVMTRRINSAYAALEAPKEAAKRPDSVRAKPIFTSGQGSQRA